MRVTAAEIVDAFEGLISGRLTREDAANWASKICAAHESTTIEYVPASAEESIWKALNFLMGVDLRDSPNSYLHVVDDLVLYWETNRREFLTEH
jgi:hypothetical protein